MEAVGQENDEARTCKQIDFARSRGSSPHGWGPAIPLIITGSAAAGVPGETAAATEA